MGGKAAGALWPATGNRVRADRLGTAGKRYPQAKGSKATPLGAVSARLAGDCD